MRKLEEDDSWRQRAACRGLDVNLFFPEVGRMANAAREVCNSCPVKKECTNFGINEIFGIWGGTSNRERQQIRRENPELKRQHALEKHGTFNGYLAHLKADETPCVFCQAAASDRMIRNKDRYWA